MENKWDIALGLIKVDGLQPTEEYLELIEKEKAGEISIENIRTIMNQSYRIKKNG